MKNDIFNKILPSEALEILKQIAKTDKKLKKRIVVPWGTSLDKLDKPAGVNSRGLAGYQ